MRREMREFSEGVYPGMLTPFAEENKIDSDSSGKTYLTGREG